MVTVKILMLTFIIYYLLSTHKKKKKALDEFVCFSPFHKNKLFITMFVSTSVFFYFSTELKQIHQNMYGHSKRTTEDEASPSSAQLSSEIRHVNVRPVGSG
jgi:hypothetical protein